jgi:hypothetical protein
LGPGAWPIVMACAQQCVPCVRASSCVKNKEPAGVLLPLEFTHQAQHEYDYRSLHARATQRLTRRNGRAEEKALEQVASSKGPEQIALAAPPLGVLVRGTGYSRPGQLTSGASATRASRGQALRMLKLRTAVARSPPAGRQSRQGHAAAADESRRGWRLFCPFSVWSYGILYARSDLYIDTVGTAARRACSTTQ